MLWSRCVSQKSPKKIVAVEPGNAETQKPKGRYQTWKSYMSASTVNCSTLPETNIAHENLIFPCKYHQTWWVFMVFHVRSRSPFPEKNTAALWNVIEAESGWKSYIYFIECSPVPLKSKINRSIFVKSPKIPLNFKLNLHLPITLGKTLTADFRKSWKILLVVGWLPNGFFTMSPRPLTRLWQVSASVGSWRRGFPEPESFGCMVKLQGGPLS